MFHYVRDVVKKPRICFDPLANPSDIFLPYNSIEIGSPPSKEDSLKVLSQKSSSVDDDNEKLCKRKAIDFDLLDNVDSKKVKLFERSSSLCFVNSKQDETEIKKRLFFYEEDHVYGRKKKLLQQSHEERAQDIHEKLKKCNLRSELAYLSSLKMKIVDVFQEFQNDLDCWTKSLKSIESRMQ